MKSFHQILFVVAVSLVLGVESSDTIGNIFINERRFLVYNSRTLTGECLSICKDRPTSKPTGYIGGSTKSPTSIPSRTPTEGTKSPTKNPTSKPTNLPSRVPTNAPTSRPTTKEPSANPTESPTNDPTDSPTRVPTNSPTATPTGSPTKAPTKNPTSQPTSGATPPPTHECVWPAEKYSAITKGDMTSGAHNVYKQIVVGGKLKNPSNSHISIDGKVYYGVSWEGKFNFNGGIEKINDFEDIRIDYNHYEWLARNMKSSNIGGKKVIVKTTGKDGSNNGCYNLYDFRLGGQGYDNGNTLVVFNTNDDICLTKTRDGRQFGPSVLAPFSKVTLTDAGFIDGVVIAKEFTTVVGSNVGSNLQLHGATYNGAIECIEVPLPSPTNTLAAAPEPKEGECKCEMGDDSDQSWKCGNTVYVCPNVDRVCASQGNKQAKYYSLTQDQCDEMKSIGIGDVCIPLPQYGVKNKKMGSRVCYNNHVNGTHGMKENVKKCKFCEDSISPIFEV